MVKTIINILERATGLSVDPLHSEHIQDCIVYNEYTLSDDGAVSRSRLELRLITKTYADAEIYQKQIINALVNIGDNVEIEGVLNCDQNGGGRLFEYNTETIHTLMYFDLITRSKKE